MANNTLAVVLLLAGILAVAPAVRADEDLLALLKDRSSEAPFCIYCGLGNTRIVCNVAEVRAALASVDLAGSYQPLLCFVAWLRKARPSLLSLRCRVTL